MKLTLAGVAVVLGVFTFVFPNLGIYAVAVAFVLFLGYGFAKSLRRRLDPLNDVPNALRVLMAALAAFLFVGHANFLSVSVAVVLFAGSILLNDEYQRRTVDSIARRRRGGAVALLGIDGSGKSTHAEELEAWFRSRGYYCTRVPFHRYLFVERLTRRGRRDKVSLGKRGRGNPLRPLLSAFDNIILTLISSFGRGIEGRVVLYDRYIWSTYVKYAALGYPVAPLRWLYMLPRPKFAVVLDVPVRRSLDVIDSRPDHIRYAGEILSREREAYLAIAREKRLPVLDATRDEDVVEGDIEGRLAAIFPVVKGAANS
jgi:dTMP kinase